MNNGIILLLLLASCSAYYRKIDIFEEFLTGVKEGMELVKTIFPTMMAFMVLVTLVQNCGILGWIEYIGKPVFDFLKIPSDIVIMMIVRPFSSSGSLSVATTIFHHYGIDHPVSILASMIQTGSDTTFYVVSLYFGSVGINRYRYALSLGLCLDTLACILALLVYKIMLC